jgi:hypothetical protein
MTRRTVISTLLFGAIVPSLSAHAKRFAQDAPDTYAKTVSWFTSMFQPLEKLAAEVDRLRLVRYLESLSHSFDHMLEDKDEIVRELGNHPINRAALSSFVSDLSDSVDQAKVSLTNVRSVLLETFQQGGKDAEAELSDVLENRKSWVMLLQNALGTRPDSDLSSFLDDAKKSRTALANADSKLLKLVVFLKSEEAARA